MSNQHEVNAALEARIAELERQLATHKQWRIPRPRVSRGVAVLVTLALLVPGIALANHQFPDVATTHTFHSEIGWVAQKNIADGFSDGTYKPSQAVTRQAMAAFLQRLGTASPMEEEPNEGFSAADLYPPAGPAMGGVMYGDMDYWQISHPGGEFQAETVGLDCSTSRSDTVLYLYTRDGAIDYNDDIAYPGNLCSRLYLSSLAAGEYFVAVSSTADVPWYALMVWVDGFPFKADPSAPAPDRPVKATNP